MKALKLISAGLVAVIAIVGVAVALPPETRTQPASAAQTCPAPTAEGAYFERGFDKETGEVVCGFSFYNECPYAAAYSADDPMCKKFEAQQSPQPVQPETPTVTTAQPQAAQCGGK